MKPKEIENLLRSVANHSLSIQQALGIIKDIPFEDLGFAKIDHHREIRRGFPEVIFCQNKATEQILSIVKRQIAHGETVFGTRATPTTLKVIKKKISGITINETAQCFWKKSSSWTRPKNIKGTVVVVSAGTSDFKVAEEAKCTLEILGHPYKLICDVGVAGIHRLTAYKTDLLNASVIIAIAGMEGALPSVITGIVSCPVIGVPTSVGYGSHFGGLVPLFAMLNSCASGMTVVNIDNGFGAALAAGLINSY